MKEHRAKKAAADAMDNLEHRPDLQEVAPTIIAQGNDHEVGLVADGEREHGRCCQCCANDHGAQRHVLRCGHLDRHRRNHGDDGDVGDQVAENSTNQVDGEEAAEVAKRSKHFDQGLACPHIQAHRLDGLTQRKGANHCEQHRRVHCRVHAVQCHRPRGQEEGHEDDQVACQGKVGQPVVHAAGHEDADGRGGTDDCPETASRVSLLRPMAGGVDLGTALTMPKSLFQWSLPISTGFASKRRMSPSLRTTPSTDSAQAISW
mmetsp:Transcript_41654/g.131764  ORF Transcript_41654/g.131764 Transcript_41654/m.131764 type:complete len:261 (+) Transcript_41654:203-985(+)